MRIRLAKTLLTINHRCWILTVAWLRLLAYGGFLFYHQLVHPAVEDISWTKTAFWGWFGLILVHIYRYKHAPLRGISKWTVYLLEIGYLVFLAVHNFRTNDSEYVSTLFILHIITVVVGYKQLEAIRLLAVHQLVVIMLYLTGVVSGNFLVQYQLALVLLSALNLYQWHSIVKERDNLLVKRNIEVLELKVAEIVNRLFQSSLSSAEFEEFARTVALSAPNSPGGIIFRKKNEITEKIWSFGVLTIEEDEIWESLLPGIRNNKPETAVHIDGYKYPAQELLELKVNTDPDAAYFLFMLAGEESKDTCKADFIWQISRLTELVQETENLQTTNAENDLYFLKMIREGILQPQTRVVKIIPQLALKVVSTLTKAEQVYFTVFSKLSDKFDHQILYCTSEDDCKNFNRLNTAVEALLVLSQDKMDGINVENLQNFDMFGKEGNPYNLIAFPLKMSDDALGYIVIQNKLHNQAFTPPDMAFGRLLARVMGRTICFRNHVSAITETHEQAITVILKALALHVPYLEEHSNKVGCLARKIGNKLELPPETQFDLWRIGRLHDVGLFGIDKYIFNKPGSLSVEEYTLVKQHPKLGVKILSSYIKDSSLLRMVEQHHEHWNGRGYPYGLKGEQIDLLARIIAVADAYNAMVSFRYHRRPYSTSEALERLMKESGKQFDPMVVDALIAVLTSENGNSFMYEIKWVRDLSKEVSTAAQWLTEKQQENLDTEIIQNLR